MFRSAMAAVALCVAPTICFAQLTYQQKVSDFQTLVGVYDKQYGPYEWKVKTFGFDLLRTRPWLERIEHSRNDLEFYDICVRYVASLNDSHDEFTLPSAYEAYLPLTADIYSGKVLIDYIDRRTLRAAAYPFAVGDEIVSLDGKGVSWWIDYLGAYAANGQGNPVSRDRLAVAIMLDRYQGWFTYASKVRAGDSATLVIRNQAGKIASYRVPWQVVGLPFTEEGPVPNPGGFSFSTGVQSGGGSTPMSMRDAAKAESNEWGIRTGASTVAQAAAVEAPAEAPAVAPNGVRHIAKYDNFAALKADHTVAGGIVPFDSFFPSFNPPPGFKLRLGGGPTDEFVSGTFPVGSKTVGFIRIPSFVPLSELDALRQFQNEMIYFNKSTQGLVIDLMGNGGGSLCYANFLVQYVDPKPFKALPARVRATQQWLVNYEGLVLYLQATGAPQGDLDIANGILSEIQKALAKNRGLSAPIDFVAPVACNGYGGGIYEPATDTGGNNIAYSKPVLLLTDNFTLSAAEAFSATLQDEKRVSVYGVPTDGGGGNVVGYRGVTGPYSEGGARVTQSLLVRNHNVKAAGFPAAPYVENIGIQPDYLAPFNTQTNLLTGGKPFVNGFLGVLAGLLQ